MLVVQYGLCSATYKTKLKQNTQAAKSPSDMGQWTTTTSINNPTMKKNEESVRVIL